MRAGTMNAAPEAGRSPPPLFCSTRPEPSRPAIVPPTLHAPATGEPPPSLAPGPPPQEPSSTADDRIANLRSLCTLPPINAPDPLSLRPILASRSAGRPWRNGTESVCQTAQTRTVALIYAGSETQYIRRLRQFHD